MKTETSENNNMSVKPYAYCTIVIYLTNTTSICKLAPKIEILNCFFSDNIPPIIPKTEQRISNHLILLLLTALIRFVMLKIMLSRCLQGSVFTKERMKQ